MLIETIKKSIKRVCFAVFFATRKVSQTVSVRDNIRDVARIFTTGGGLSHRGAETKSRMR